eukprot:TRINITY_DN8565_c0_g1_i1.p1 TRINITY_DN8565_c0_g1~~TRINITY_DN8565_c0_g1_i1.p1  ORF type:complete len:316 (+),score=67.62 TRINITY_DN8565_c0_g1_i1:352-1299(+)
MRAGLLIATAIMATAGFRCRVVPPGNRLPPTFKTRVEALPKGYWKKCQADPQKETIVGLMVTGKDAEHKQFALNAVESFLNQSYPSKALVIINDSPIYRITDFIRHPCIIELDGSLRDDNHTRATLGELRNLGLAAVPGGAVYVQWDDDDWRPPSYLSGQYSAMMAANASACILRRQLRLFLHRNSSYIYEQMSTTRTPFVIGTIMARKTGHNSGVVYPAAGKGEDWVFLQHMMECVDQVHVWNNPPDAYFRVFHGHNTFDIEHFKTDHLQDNKWCQAIKAGKALSRSKKACRASSPDHHRLVLERYHTLLRTGA